MEYKCKYCNSENLFTEKHGNNTGLYCSDCGKYQQWLNKNELRAFKQYQKKLNESHSLLKAYENTIDDSKLKEELHRFVDYLDETINKEMKIMPLSPEDSIRKNSYCLALERDKNTILNILDGNKFNEIN